MPQYAFWAPSKNVLPTFTLAKGEFNLHASALSNSSMYLQAPQCFGGQQRPGLHSVHFTPGGLDSDTLVANVHSAIQELAVAYPVKKLKDVQQKGSTKRSLWPIATVTWGFTYGPGMNVRIPSPLWCFH